MKTVISIKTVVCLLILFVLVGGNANASDQFERVRCGSDVRKALIGQKASNERIVVLEDRYEALGLKNLGADQISDSLYAVDWLICGNEYVLLEDELVRDVILLPPHSKSTPAFSGICQVNGRDLADVIIAVLNFAPGTRPLTAAAAWKIDTKRAKFVKMSTDGLVCPRSGIFTTDGGQ
jgi:hypothetical protein